MDDGDIEVRSSPPPTTHQQPAGEMDLEPAVPGTDDADMLPEPSAAGEDIEFADAEPTDIIGTDADTAMEQYDGHGAAEVEMGDGTVGETISYDDEDTRSIASVADPPPFRSPPRVQTRDGDHQRQALGHTSRGEEDYTTQDYGEEGEGAGDGEEGGQDGVGQDDHEDEDEAGQPEAGPSGTNGTDQDEEGEEGEEGGEGSEGGDEASEEGKRQTQQDGGVLASQNQDDAQDDEDAREQEQTMEDKSRNVQRLTQKQRQDRGEGDKAKQINEVTVRQRSPPDQGIEVSTDQRNSGPQHPSEGGPIEQVNVVNVMSSDDDCASNTASGATLVRPRPAKDLIREVTFGPVLSRYFDHFKGRESHSPGSKPTQGGLSANGDGGKKPRLRAPPVILTYKKVRYTLFCERDAADVEEAEAAADAERVAAEGGGEGGGEGEREGEGEGEGEEEEKEEVEEGGVLFSKPEDHALYFNHLESLCAKLHHLFDGFTAEGKEMVLIFDELGISAPEDNVYTREISLYDLDRLHVGANLPGRLHIFLESQPRLIHRFNILAGHVSRLLEDDDAGSEYYEGDDGEANGGEDPLDEEAVAAALGRDDDATGDDDGDYTNKNATTEVKATALLVEAENATGETASLVEETVAVTQDVEDGGKLKAPATVVASETISVARRTEDLVGSTDHDPTEVSLASIPSGAVSAAGEADESSETPSSSTLKSVPPSVDVTPPALSTRSHDKAVSRKRSSDGADVAAEAAAEPGGEGATKKARVT